LRSVWATAPPMARVEIKSAAMTGILRMASPP
jgi:hypothetical protein